MSRKVSATQGRKSRRKGTLLWVAVLTAVVITLLFLEQTALLYVLATVGLTVLLVIVALSDLSGAHKTLSEAPPADDAAAIGTGISSAIPQAPAAARPAPRARKRT